MTETQDLERLRKRVYHLEHVLWTLIAWLQGTGLNQEQCRELLKMVDTPPRLEDEDD